jgi:hypothetical protein
LRIADCGMRNADWGLKGEKAPNSQVSGFRPALAFSLLTPHMKLHEVKSEPQNIEPEISNNVRIPYFRSRNLLLK